MRKIIISESQFRVLVDKQIDEQLEMSEIGFHPGNWENYTRNTNEKFLNYIKSHRGDDYSKLRGKKLKNLPYDNIILSFPTRKFVILFNDVKEPVFMITAYKYRDGYQMVHTYANPEVRGQGLGMRVYEEFARFVGKPLYSGSNQTENSRYGIWRKLIEKYPQNMSILNLYNDQLLPLDSGVDPYEGYYLLKLQF